MYIYERLKKHEPLFDVWLVGEQLGSGSYSEVYKLYHKDDHDVVSALKVIPIPKSQNELDIIKSSYSDKDKVQDWVNLLVAKYKQEVDMLYKLKDCPNIVRFLNFNVKSQENGIGKDILINMEYLIALTKIYCENLSVSDIAKLGIDICFALESLQKKDIIHRDIKPDNIFYSPESGRYKLGDFGLAKMMELRAISSERGTPLYNAPEIEARGILHKGQIESDIYSLGLVMYFLLNNNRLPFVEEPGFESAEEARIKRLRGEKFPLPVRAGENENLAKIVLKACAYSPKNRYLSAVQMRNDLESILDECNKIGDLTLAATDKRNDFSGNPNEIENNIDQEETIDQRLEILAKQGDLEAQHMLSLAYRRLKLTRDVYDTAWYWCNESANGGYLEAEIDFAEHYCFNLEEAIVKYRRLAVSHGIPVKYRLSQWLKVIAGQKDSKVRYGYDKLHQRKDNKYDCKIFLEKATEALAKPEDFKRTNIHKFPEIDRLSLVIESLSWLLSIADESIGNTSLDDTSFIKDALLELADIYLRVWCDNQEQYYADKGIHYFKRAMQYANEGCGWQKYNLSVWLEKTGNSDEAKEWCEKAAKEGYDNAIYEMITKYEWCDVTSENPEPMIKWTEAALSSDSSRSKRDINPPLSDFLSVQLSDYAKNLYGSLCYYGIGIPQDYGKAFQYYLEAAEAGYAMAVNNVGVCYFMGYGVEQDTFKAFEYFSDASSGIRYKYDIYAHDAYNPVYINHKEAYYLNRSYAENKETILFNERICGLFGFGTEQQIQTALACLLAAEPIRIKIVDGERNMPLYSAIFLSEQGDIEEYCLKEPFSIENLTPRQITLEPAGSISDLETIFIKDIDF